METTNEQVLRGEPVEIAFGEILDESKRESIFPRLCKAFGNDPECLGLLIVTGLPPSYHDLRRRVLASASYVAHLPPAELERLENEKSSFLVGWSRGREQFRGRPDVNKGSFYANPTYDYPQDQATEFPEYETANIWPESEEFKAAFVELGTLIVHVGSYVARACDYYVKTQAPEYQQDYLERMVRTSKTCKARLLHYFPTSESTVQPNTDDDGASAWCGEHLDHGCLTGLTSAMYLQDRVTGTGTATKELDTSPDPQAGLYIKSRSGKTHHLNIPREALAFQTGQALEVVTSSKLRAVPHFVRGSAVTGVSRNTLAVFMQPNLEDELGPRGAKFKDFARGIVQESHVSSQ